jgi:hypothetical protein
LQHSSGLEIPIGVIAELNIGQVQALGLISRAKLSETETNMIGRVLRPKLVNPFDFLEDQFNWAFLETPPGEALAQLSRRYSESLFFAPPREEKIRKALPEGASAAHIILGDLRRHRDNEFYLMLAELDPSSTLRPCRETSQLAA